MFESIAVPTKPLPTVVPLRMTAAGSRQSGALVLTKSGHLADVKPILQVLGAFANHETNH